MKKKIKAKEGELTTYDRFVEKLTAHERQKFEEEYQEFMVSELLIAAMTEDGISVRKLAEAAGVSPTIVQGIRSATRNNVSVKSLFKVLDVLGYHLVAEKNGNRLPIDISQARKR